MIVQQIKDAGLTVAEVARKIGCQPSNIYRWDRHGLSIESHYYPLLRQLVPDLGVNCPITKKGLPSKKCNAGNQSKRVNLVLGNDDGKKITEQKYISETFPRIKI